VTSAVTSRMTEISYSGYRFPPEIIQQDLALCPVHLELSGHEWQRSSPFVQAGPTSPKIIQAIAGGTAPAGLTVSRLTQALPYAWTTQEQMLGLS
jgi:hypothetical protein